MTAPRTHRLWAALTILTYLASLAQSTCYKPNGTAWDSEGAKGDVGDVVPCNSGAVSHCCTTTDFCASNGLCINAGDDNMYTIQGCTDPTWSSSPCVGGFTNDANFDRAFVHLWACKFFTSANGAKSAIYCRGETADCCNNSTTINLDRFTSLYRPQGATATQAEATSSTSPTGTGTASPASNSSGSSDSTAVQVGLGTTSLKVGLGLGIPLGVGAIAATAFLAMQIRRRNNLYKKSMDERDITVPRQYEDSGPITPPLAELPTKHTTPELGGKPLLKMMR